MRDGAHTDMSGHTISAAGASADTRVSRGWADRDLLIVVFRLHRTARHGGPAAGRIDPISLDQWWRGDGVRTDMSKHTLAPAAEIARSRRTHRLHP